MTLTNRDVLAQLTNHPESMMVGKADHWQAAFAANLIGFSVGLGGAADLATALMSRRREGVAVLAGVAVTLYNGVLVMLELRAAEMAAAIEQRKATDTEQRWQHRKKE